MPENGIVSKMHYTRERKATANRALKQGSMLDITAENDNIPVQENWSERWCTMPSTFSKAVVDILELEVRPEDVFIVTFIKCGTTWMQEAAWLLLNNLDYEAASKSGVMQRSVFLEYSTLFVQYDKIVDTIEACKNMSDPRLIKSHLPAHLLPQQIWHKKTKIIYVARNVKDVVVSSYHFLKGLGEFSGSMPEFVDAFMHNEIMYAPFLAHVVDFWKMRNEPFIFFVTYEEMKRDLSGVLQKLSKFLGTPELSDDQLQAAVEHLSFNKMKDNKQTNLTQMLKESLPDLDPSFQFMRRGIVGSFRDELTAEDQARLDAWSTEYLAKYGIKQEEIFGKL